MKGFYLAPEIAEEADKIAEEQYKNHIHPVRERIETDKEGKKTYYNRDPDAPATLWMVQYYYHLGNLYKDKIDTKANILIWISISALVIAIVALCIELI